MAAVAQAAASAAAAQVLSSRGQPSGLQVSTVQALEQEQKAFADSKKRLAQKREEYQAPDLYFSLSRICS